MFDYPQKLFASISNGD
jgi:hypothetical protein